MTPKDPVDRSMRDAVADGLATAMLAGPWTQAAMTTRCAWALGRPRGPKWLPLLVAEVVTTYPQPPRDRPRELTEFLPSCPAWQTAWRHRHPPRVVAWSPATTAVTTHPWPVSELPDLAALCRLLDIDQGELAWFADVRGLEHRSAEPLRHYRWRSVARQDSLRLVAAPKPRLKEIQRRLLRHVLAPIPLHPAAHGAAPGHSVSTALAMHARSTVVIRADLESYFASIPAGRVYGLLRTAGLPEPVAHVATGLLTTVVPGDVWRDARYRAPRSPAVERLGRRLRVPHLPLGAPSSPALANLVAYALDRRLDGLAGRFGARYTRYVDDLVFSGGPLLRRARSRFVNRVRQIVSEEGFVLNERKTVVLGDAGRQALLGAVVNDRPTLPRPERDALRATLHNCEMHGWRSQARDVPDLRSHLQGRVAWAAGLDPVLGARLRAQWQRIDWS